MTSWTIRSNYVGSDPDLQGFLRWNLGTNLDFTRKGTSKLLCNVRSRDVIEDVSGKLASRQVRLVLDLEYSVKRERNHVIVEGPGRTSLHKAVVERYHSLGDNSQTALLPQLFTNLVRIPAIRQVMTPLRAILLELSDSGSIRLSDRSFRRYEPSKAKKYVSLLSQLGYVKSEGDQFVPATPFERAGTTYGEGGQMVPKILADALRKGSGFMVDVLGWRLMVPYLRWSNAYYWKALEADRLPLLSLNSWTASHLQLYGSPTHGNPRTQIDDMVETNIVSYEKKGFLGREEVFEPYRKQALAIPIVQETLAAS